MISILFPRTISGFDGSRRNEPSESERRAQLNVNSINASTCCKAPRPPRGRIAPEQGRHFPPYSKAPRSYFRGRQRQRTRYSAGARSHSMTIICIYPGQSRDYGTDLAQTEFPRSHQGRYSYTYAIARWCGLWDSIDWRASAEMIHTSILVDVVRPLCARPTVSA